MARLRAESVERLGAIAGGGALVAGFPQAFQEHFSDGRVVVHDQDLYGVRHPALRRIVATGPVAPALNLGPRVPESTPRNSRKPAPDADFNPWSGRKRHAG